MKNSKFFENSNIIGSKLKYYRQSKNISQEMLCNQLALMGITLYQNDIYKIENNTRTVKDFELLGISKVLDVNIYDLFEHDNLEIK